MKLFLTSPGAQIQSRAECQLTTNLVHLTFVYANCTAILRARGATRAVVQKGTAIAETPRKGGLPNPVRLQYRFSHGLRFMFN